MEAASEHYLRAYELDASNAGKKAGMAQMMMVICPCWVPPPQPPYSTTNQNTHPGALGNYCNVLQSLGPDAVHDAEACYKRVTEAHPNYDRAWVNLGGLYYVTGSVILFFSRV